MANKMQFHSVTCPNCNAALEIEDGIDTFFCRYCGYKIILEGQSDAAYQAKTTIKQMEHEERMADKKYNQEKEKELRAEKKEDKETRLTFILLAVMLSVCLIIGFVAIRISNQNDKKEEEQLTQLIEEINTDIDNQDFDEAYVKAQSIRWSDDDDDEENEKWDSTRREVINRIINAEEKANGKSTHEPEKEVEKGTVDKILDFLDDL